MSQRRRFTNPTGTGRSMSLGANDPRVRRDAAGRASSVDEPASAAGSGTGTPGPRGPAGPAGPAGANGAAGSNGEDGQGVPAGGTAGQVLEKIDGTDYNTQWATPSGGGVTDHGALTGLADDDHTQYLRADGTRAMSAALDMGTFAITNVGSVDGRDVSVDGAKLDGIEPNATADQTAADIRALGFFDTTNDGTGSGLDADTVDGVEEAALLRADGTRAMSGSLNLGGNAVTNGTISGSLLGIASVPLNKITQINDGTILGNDAGSGGPPIALDASRARGVLGVVPITIGSTAPSSPSNGDLWVDTNVNPAEMCTYDATRGHWFGPPVYVSFGKANSTGAGVGHFLYSGVNGTTATTAERGWLAPWDGTVTGWAFHSQTTLSGWTLRLDKNDGSGTNTTGFVSRVVNTDRFNDMTVDGDFGSGNVIGAALVSGSNSINNSTLTVRLQRRAS